MLLFCPIEARCLNMLPVGRLLNDPAMLVHISNQAAAALQAVGPLCVGYAYTPPLGLRFGNCQASLARSLQAADVDGVMQEECVYERFTAYYKRKDVSPNS